MNDDRFWAKVDRSQGCWLWLGYRTQRGYGSVTRDGKPISAHRYAYMLVWGPVPEGLTLDHLCRVRHCVNPFHLEPVTNRENVLRGIGLTAVNARKTECIHGHLYDEHNTHIRPDGSRNCKPCWRDEANRRNARKRAVAQAAVR